MPRLRDEPNMSDNTLLVSIEDLINRALGPPDVNTVNFKLIQMILHILARQQRLLEQKVEIKVTDLAMPKSKTKTKGRDERSPSRSSRSPSRGRMSGIKEERESRKDKETKEKQKAEREALKEKERSEKAEQKEKKKAEKMEMKDKEKAEKMELKEKEKAQKQELKEKEKAQKLELKEKEKAEKMGMKEKEKAEKMEMKEKEKAEKMAQKEKEKAERATEKEERQKSRSASKEREKAEKETQKEKEKEKKKEQEKTEREKSPASLKGGKKTAVSSATSIAVTETQRDKEKVLVVEKGPTTRTDSRGRGSIEVVTQSQFAMLEQVVKELKDAAVPRPLVLPDNEKLRSDLARGSASLTDTMQAMQVNARVKAAEETIDRMAWLLTELAAAGALPDDLAEKVGDVRVEAELLAGARAEGSTIAGTLSHPSQIAGRKSVAIDPTAKTSSMTTPEGGPRPRAQSTPPTPRGSQLTRPSILSKPSTASMAYVTHDEMSIALKQLRDELSKNLTSVTTKAGNSADTALQTAQAVSDKIEIAMKLDTRISTLNSLVSDYAEQLSGFDSGLSTQMQGFQDQMAQIRADLKSGLVQLENVNNNAETAAVMELSERYDELAGELDTTLHSHRALAAQQEQLAVDVHSLVECVEMLREEKCDRDEVLDGLRDKADISRLAGLLSEAQFAGARADLQGRLDLCHDKFSKQEAQWMGAIKELSRLTDSKAELIELMSARDDAQRQLRELHEQARLLADVLGEPKAALLTRKLASGARCGACQAGALMEPQDAATGAPPRLPALRPPPVATEKPCLQPFITAEPSDDRHICHRWCGGSHTLVGGSTTREQAEPAQLQTVPTSKYTGYGSDGRLYMMEEELQPCIECNLLSTEENGGKETEAALPCTGAGDAEQPIAPPPQK